MFLKTASSRPDRCLWPSFSMALQAVRHAHARHGASGAAAGAADQAPRPAIPQIRVRARCCDQCRARAARSGVADSSASGSVHAAKRRRRGWRCWRRKSWKGALSRSEALSCGARAGRGAAAAEAEATQQRSRNSSRSRSNSKRSFLCETSIISSFVCTIPCGSFYGRITCSC